MSQLYGSPNPKTLIPPVIVPPSHAFDAWRQSSITPNNYVNAPNPISHVSQSGLYFTRPEETFQINFNDGGFNGLPPYEGPNRTINTNLGITTSDVYSVKPTYEYGVALREEILKTPMYDPRAYGYGPANRVHIDRDTGLPFFDYRDIDASRRNNYITRTMLPDKFETGTADDQFRLDSNSFRTDLQTSQMLKRNGELWQQRLAPISSFKFL